MMLFSAIPSFNVEASNLTSISDFISTSRPGYPANHTIIFKTTKAIPPNGKIKITPEDGYFLVLAGLDYTDVDLATSTDRDSGFEERDLFNVPLGSADGVNTISATTSSSTIEITLRNTYGIESGTYVRIKIGDNASYQENGTTNIINPGNGGSYHIFVDTYDAGDSLLDRADPMIAIVKAVKTISYMPKIRSRGSPSGTLTFGTVSTIMSLVTNYEANCRYSTASNTLYTLMSDDFSYTGHYFHSITLTGLLGGLNKYYVRCQDMYAVNDTSDYVITFFIENYPGEGTGNDNSSTTDEGTGGTTGDDTGGDTGSDGGSGGGGGGGGGGGSGSSSGIYDPYPVPPTDPAVSFSGFTYPNSNVYLVVDGVANQDTRSNSLGEFNFGIDEMDRGMYSFGLYSVDPENKNSLSYNTTFYVEEGTKSEVGGIFISPTINTNTTEINIGDLMELHGYGAASTYTEVWFYPYLERTVREEEIIKQQVDVGTDGLWNMILDTSKAYGGQYRLKSRSYKEGIGFSEFSDVINIGVGEAVKEQTGECANGDLNGDGKVNITDFSIMLYWWTTDNACADQNNSGNVDLTDFSIMMFYWTG